MAQRRRGAAWRCSVAVCGSGRAPGRGGAGRPRAVGVARVALPAAVGDDAHPHPRRRGERVETLKLVNTAAWLRVAPPP